MCLGKIERLVAVWGAVARAKVVRACGAVLSLAYTPEAEEGLAALAHAGVSLRLLEADEATRAVELRDAMGA